MELLSSNIKKIQEMETPQKIPYISENRDPKKASYILGNETFPSTIRKFTIHQEMKTPKKLIFSQKNAFHVFPETETRKILYI